MSRKNRDKSSAFPILSQKAVLDYREAATKSSEKYPTDKKVAPGVWKLEKVCRGNARFSARIQTQLAGCTV